MQCVVFFSDEGGNEWIVKLKKITQNFIFCLSRKIGVNRLKEDKARNE